jgi:hypothetical protein
VSGIDKNVPTEEIEQRAYQIYLQRGGAGRLPLGNRSTLKQQMEEWFLVAILFALVIGTVIAYVMRR